MTPELDRAIEDLLQAQGHPDLYSYDEARRRPRIDQLRIAARGVARLLERLEQKDDQPCRRILVVDDSPAMRAIVVRTLRRAGYEHEIEEARHGVEALEVIGTSPPDLVLSDWNMPEMTGIELLEELNRRGIKARFGFVTGEAGPETRRRAADAGALFFITKPFTVDTFLAALAPVIGAP